MLRVLALSLALACGILLAPHQTSALFLHGGGQLTSPCGPHTAPAPAAAAGLTCETFFDGPFSLTTIDTNDTGSCTAACKWYTHNTMPNYPGGASTITSPNCPSCIWNYGAMSATPSGDYSISGGNLVLAPASNTPYAGLPIMLSTVRYSGGVPGYIGKTFKMPFYIEFIAPSASTSSAGGEPNAIVWMVPTEFTAAGIGAAYHFPELDLCEPAFGCSFVHDWQGTGAGTASQDNSGQADATVCANTSARCGLLFLDAAHNGGVNGAMYYYVNDVLKGSIAWNGSFGSNPAMSPNNPNGVLAEGEIQHFALQLGAGFNKNMTVQQIRAFELPL